MVPYFKGQGTSSVDRSMDTSRVPSELRPGIRDLEPSVVFVYYLPCSSKY